MKDSIPGLPNPKKDQCYVYICTTDGDVRRQVAGEVSRRRWVQLLGELEIAKQTIMKGLEE